MSETIDPNLLEERLECKYACYQKAIDGSNDDLLLVKEVIHRNDGTKTPRIRLFENFQRPFYITKPMWRNHQDKKEYEDIDRLTKYMCTQAELPTKIQLALGNRLPNPRAKLRDVCTNPYVYYADITTPTLVKQYYRTKYPDTVSPNLIAVCDTETDVLFGTNDTILISVTMGTTKLLGIVEWWADRIPNLDKRLPECYDKYLNDIEIKTKDGVKKLNLVEERGHDITVIIEKTPGRMIAEVISRIHNLFPDFLAFWNMNYDIPRILQALKKDGINPGDVFCDPCVPEKYRYVNYIEAKSKRITNSKSISQHPADLWHVLDCLAGFYVIDAMCLFKKIRVAKGNESSYDLDSVLNRHLGIGKLKFKEADGLKKLKWHRFMQQNYPVEYMVYNLFDSISIELLDEKTNDLKYAITALAEISEYRVFPSLPKRLVDILHFFWEGYGKIAGSCGNEIVTAHDEDIISLQGHIVTLPPHLIERNGLYCIAEVPELQTSIRAEAADADILQAYPTAEIICNVSKATTAIEVLEIEGVSDKTRRELGINLTGGKVNAIDFCVRGMNMPYLDEVLDDFDEFIKEESETCPF